MPAARVVGAPGVGAAGAEEVALAVGDEEASVGMVDGSLVVGAVVATESNAVDKADVVVDVPAVVTPGAELQATRAANAPHATAMPARRGITRGCRGGWRPGPGRSRR